MLKNCMSAYEDSLCSVSSAASEGEGGVEDDTFEEYSSSEQERAGDRYAAAFPSEHLLAVMRHDIQVSSSASSGPPERPAGVGGLCQCAAQLAQLCKVGGSLNTRLLIEMAACLSACCYCCRTLWRL